MKEDLRDRIKNLARWLYESRYRLSSPGQGISTESGLSDFRGPDGVWTRQDKDLSPKPMAKSREEIEPNRGHLAILELYKIGKLKFLISQNVDNLHLKSGIPPCFLAELHGNRFKLRCTRCEKTIDRPARQKVCDCGGALVSSVVDFGQPLPQRDLNLAFEHSRTCDLFIVLGYSLVVTAAAKMPVEALRSGAKLIIVNKGETPLDRLASLRFHENIGEVFPEAVEELKNFMNIQLT